MSKEKISESSISRYVALFFPLGIGIASALSTFFFVGSGDHDAYMMAAGINHGIRTGQVINPMNYGNHAQFMFYYIANFIGGIVRPDGAAILLAINALGTALAVVTPLLLYALIKRNFSIPSPHLVPVLVITNSAYLFSLPLGHPFQYSFAISLISFILLFEAFRAEGFRLFALFAVSAVLQGTALTIRAEQVFLFWFCVAALFIYSKELDRKKWAGLLGLYAFSFIYFYLLHKALVPNIPGVTYDPGAAEKMTSVAGKYTDLILKTYSPASLKWSLPYHLTEIGVPLILMTLYFVYRAAVEKRAADLLALAVSAGPTFMIYAGNPTPPRHFLITVIALSIFIAVSVRIKRDSALVLAGVAVLAINIAFPPFLNMVEPSSGERRNHTLNFYQKLERNKLEIDAVLPAVREITEKDTDNIVVFGKWVHISQFLMAASGRDKVKLSRTNIILGDGAPVKSIEIKFGQRSVYLVETYQADETLKLAERIRQTHPDFSFVSFFTGGNRPLNDLNLKIPDEASYWSS